MLVVGVTRSLVAAGWLLALAAGSTDELFVLVPPLKAYKSLFSPRTDQELQSWGPGLTQAVTGSVNEFTIELHSLKQVTSGSFLGLYATLEGASTTIGIFVASEAAMNTTTFRFEYEPIIPGTYTLSVDAINTGATVAIVPLHGRRVIITGADLFDAPSRAARCDRQDLARGDWIKCHSSHHKALVEAAAAHAGESHSLRAMASCLRWGDMIFVPRTCHWDVFSKEELRNLAGRAARKPLAPLLEERLTFAPNISRTNPMVALEHSIVFLGTSVTRGIMYSLVDLILGEWNRGDALDKCWGQLQVRYRQLTVSYQDMRSFSYGSWPPWLQSGRRKYECHDDHVAVDYIELERNTTLFMRNLFASNPTTVVFQFQHLYDDYEATVKMARNLLQVPSWWKGNLIGLFMRDVAVLKTLHLPLYYERTWSKVFGRPVRILDSRDIVAPMLRHQEYGLHGTSMHWGERRRVKNGDVNTFGIVQDQITQFILGVHFGSKKAWGFEAKDLLQNSPQAPATEDLEVCFDCPPDLLPFHTFVEPQLRCQSSMPSGSAYKVGLAYKAECPKSCLQQAVFGHLPVHGGGYLERRACEL